MWTWCTVRSFTCIFLLEKVHKMAKGENGFKKQSIGGNVLTKMELIKWWKAKQAESKLMRTTNKSCVMFWGGTQLCAQECANREWEVNVVQMTPAFGLIAANPATTCKNITKMVGAMEETWWAMCSNATCKVSLDKVRIWENGQKEFKNKKNSSKGGQVREKMQPQKWWKVKETKKNATDR